MYRYAELEGTILESGQRYSPYLHRQRIPFMALERAEFNIKQLYPSFVIKCVLRSIRDVHDMPVSSRLDKNGFSKRYLRTEYAKIWEPGLEVFSDMLAGLGLAQSEKASAHANVYKQIKDLGFDLIRDSYYNSSVGLNCLASILSTVLFEDDEKRILRQLRRLTRKAPVLAEQLPCLSVSVRKANRENLGILEDCVLKSGNLIALNYFASFHSHYCLQDSTLKMVVAAIRDGDYTNKEVLKTLYADIAANYPKFSSHQMYGESQLSKDMQSHVTNLFSSVD